MEKERKKENSRMKKDIALVYMVAGISSRFGGRIKQFAKVGKGGESLIEYSLKQALPAGFSKIIFIVGNNTERKFKEIFGESFQGIPVYYSLQKYDSEVRDKPLGTSDAVCSARDLLDCSFVVCNGDDLYGENTFKILVEHLQKYNEDKQDAAVGYKPNQCLPDEGGGNRGIFQVSEEGYVKSIVEVFGIEKKNLAASGTKPDDLCSMNIWALHPETLDFLYEELGKFKAEHKDDREAECLLPNTLSNLIAKGKIKMRLYPAIEKCIGVTRPEDEEVVRKRLIKNY